MLEGGGVWVAGGDFEQGGLEVGGIYVHRTYKAGRRGLARGVTRGCRC